VERSQRSPLAIQNQQLATPPLMTFLERGTAGRLDFLFRCRCIPLVPRHLRLSDTAHLAGAGCVGKRLCFMATSTLALQMHGEIRAAVPNEPRYTRPCAHGARPRCEAR